MAYDAALVDRLRNLVQSFFPDLIEKKMFGGFSYLRNGNFAFGANMQLVVRVGKEQFQDALARDHVREMDFTGRPMNGWVYVDSPAIETDENLLHWIQKGVDFADSLPAK